MTDTRGKKKERRKKKQRSSLNNYEEHQERCVSLCVKTKKSIIMTDELVLVMGNEGLFHLDALIIPSGLYKITVLHLPFPQMACPSSRLTSESSR